MSAPDDAYEVGYGRPPKETRWKKGQSGNPGPKKRRPAAVATVEIIDRLFVKPVEIVENGVVRKVSTLEAILMRLVGSGNLREQTRGQDSIAVSGARPEGRQGTRDYY